MNKTIKEQIIFALEDDNEGMTAALAPDSDLDEENKQMNRELIQRHRLILAKLDRREILSQDDLVLIRDANEIHKNDTLDLGGHHKEALALEHWLANMTDLDRESRTPARVPGPLPTLREEGPNSGVGAPAFDDEGRCLRCGSRVSFADVTDTVVFAGDEIVKRYDGGITNRHCVKCTYPKQYPEYQDYDEGEAQQRA